MQESRYLSVETRQELLRIENAWHRAVYNAVTRLGSKTFAVTQGGRSSGLTLDWSGGFALYDTETRDYQWRYKFSQLKGSSDDSKTKLKLHFQNENKEIETKIQRSRCCHQGVPIYYGRFPRKGCRRVGKTLNTFYFSPFFLSLSELGVSISRTFSSACTPS
ncbi:hypothetical protein C7M84_011774 [Penaeus vannamei]|uniref:Syntrophin C-terminal PH domain-containing protein n=1 Tax=Penaeus vannamei TaxID=6689 RepID=A0A423T0G4_PENVA|nr:hypothetical protein C7M84_011774 [Penaeus vannamei]